MTGQHQQRTPSTAPPHQSLEQFESQRPNEPAGSAEEFPPLNSRINGEGLSQPNGFTSTLESPEMQPRQADSQQAQLPLRQNNITYSANQQAPIGQLSQPQLSSSRNGQRPSQSVGITKYADMTENEKWGLPGLMAALEARRQAESGGPIDDTLPPVMRSAVFMGQDLNDLGMSLDSQEPLYATFTPFPIVGSSGSTYDFHDRHVVPDFTLPSAYTVTNVPPLSSRMAAFSDGEFVHRLLRLDLRSVLVMLTSMSTETLFSIFYQTPRDIAQELAAQELTAREWRWHKVLRQWLQKDTRESNTGSSLPLVDLAGGAPIGAQPVRVGERSERGVYIFFDATNWQRERREFVLDYEQLDHNRNPAAQTNGSSIAAGGVVTGMHNGLTGMPQTQPQPVL